VKATGRWVGRSAGVIAAAAGIFGLVRAGQAIEGGVSSFWLYVGGLATIGLVALYLLSDTPGFRLAARLVFHSILMVPMIPVLWVTGWAMRAAGAIQVWTGSDEHR
jgi:hypothetical protein